METLESILSKHPFFEGLAKPYLELVIGCASNARFNKGEYLFREGEEAVQFFVIQHGKVAIETAIPDQGSITLYTHDEGEVIGWSWLFSPYHWHFSCRAMELTRAIVLDGVSLLNKCEQDHTLGYEFMKRFSYKVTRSLDFTRIQLLDLYGTPPTR
ncbi:MAG: cyclic nucleotide-binding domain-containing protein [Anaerolineae bacterium]|nr:cyclic nucleotide-binding domain-containing protein [Anaerolineae bacterium]